LQRLATPMRTAFWILIAFLSAAQHSLADTEHNRDAVLNSASQPTVARLNLTLTRAPLSPASAWQGAPSPNSPHTASPLYEHRFWDRENIVLFSLVGASRALDYSSTLNMRRRGNQEILLTNDVVDNHAAFAAIEVAGTAVSIGASYLFHRYHHHRLERWTSIVHASLATTGAVRNYCLKTQHPSTTP